MSIHVYNQMIQNLCHSFEGGNFHPSINELYRKRVESRALDAAIDRRLNDDKTVDSLLDDVVRAGEEPERFENIA